METETIQRWLTATPNLRRWAWLAPYLGRFPDGVLAFPEAGLPNERDVPRWMVNDTYFVYRLVERVDDLRRVGPRDGPLTRVLFATGAPDSLPHLPTEREVPR